MGPTLRPRSSKLGTCQGFTLAHQTPFQNQHFRVCVASHSRRCSKHRCLTNLGWGQVKQHGCLEELIRYFNLVRMQNLHVKAKILPSYMTCLGKQENHQRFNSMWTLEGINGQLSLKISNKCLIELLKYGLHFHYVCRGKL